MAGRVINQYVDTWVRITTGSRLQFIREHDTKNPETESACPGNGWDYAGTDVTEQAVSQMKELNQ